MLFSTINTVLDCVGSTHETCDSKVEQWGLPRLLENLDFADEIYLLAQKHIACPKVQLETIISVIGEADTR